MIAPSLDDLTTGVRRMLPVVVNTLASIAKAAEAFAQAHTPQVTESPGPARVVRIETLASDADGYGAVVALDDRGRVWILRIANGEASGRAWDIRRLPNID